MSRKSYFHPEPRPGSVTVRVYNKSDGRFVKDLHCMSKAQARRIVAVYENVHSLTRVAIILDKESDSNE